MSEILKEELERIEKEAEEFAGPATEEKYPVGYLNRYEGFVAGAKAEHSHLKGRIAELEEENKRLTKLSEAAEKMVLAVWPKFQEAYPFGDEDCTEAHEEYQKLKHN